MAVKENITRRRVMAGLAVTPALAAPLGATEAPSPLRALYHRWQATKDEFDALAAAGEEEAEDILFEEMTRLERVAANLVPLTLEDLWFKIIFADDNGDMTGNIHQEALAKDAYTMVGVRRRIRDGITGMVFEDEGQGSGAA